MKASTGIILNVYEGYIDGALSGLSKINAFVVIKHGLSALKTNVCTAEDLFPKWNQLFYLEKLENTIEFEIFHKPLLLKDTKIGCCAISVSNQNGWVKLYRKQQHIGSIKIGISKTFA